MTTTSNIDWEASMNESLVAQVVEFFKASYGIRLNSAESLIQMEN